MSLTFTKRKNSVDPDIRKLQDAVAAMKQAEQNGKSKPKESIYMLGEDYWTPSNAALPSSGNNNNSKASSIPQVTRKNTPLEEKPTSRREYRRQFRIQKFPLGTAIVAVFLVQYQASYRAASELNDHIGGSLALSIVNSPWQQILLAGVTWYFIGAMLLQLVEGVQHKLKDEEA